MRFHDTTDSLPNNFTALNVLFNHRFDLTNLEHVIIKRGIIGIASYNKDHVLFSKTPPVLGFLSLPTFWVLNNYYGIHYLSPKDIVASNYSQYIGKISGAFYCSLAAVLLFFILKKLFDTKIGLINTAVFVLGTGVFNTASQANLQHGISLFFLTGVLLIWLYHSKKLLAILGCGFLLGLLFQMRISNGFYLLFPIIYIFINRKIYPKPFIQIGTLMGGFLSLYCCFILFNILSKIPYGYQNELWFSLQQLTLPIFFINMVSILFSFNYGLFFFSPVLLLGLLSFFRFKQLKKERYIVSLLPSLIIFIVFASSWWMWTGGKSLDARLLIEALPILIILLAFSMHHFGKTRIYTFLFIFLFFISIGTHLLTSYFMHYYWYDLYTKAGHMSQTRNAWYFKPSLLEYVARARNLNITNIYKRNGKIIVREKVFRPSIKYGGLPKIYDKEKLLFP